MQATQRQYAQALYELLSRSTEQEGQEIIQQLLQTLQRQGKLSWVHRIVQLVNDFVEEEQGIVSAHVTTAHTMSEEQIKSLLQQLLDAENVQVTTTEDGSLLGGLKIETKDQRFDLTMKRQLNDLAKTLVS